MKMKMCAATRSKGRAVMRVSRCHAHTKVILTEITSKTGQNDRDTDGKLYKEVVSESSVRWIDNDIRSVISGYEHKGQLEG